MFNQLNFEVRLLELVYLLICMTCGVTAAIPCRSCVRHVTVYAHVL
jgi:hypothetical protein